MKKPFMIFSYIACGFLFLFAFGLEVYAVCPLGPDVTKDLYGILKIINIVAPLLVIGFTIADAIRALTQGDSGPDMKKVAQKFAKRCVYAVILFFLPMLVDQVMQMADVWGVNGTCDLEHPTENLNSD